MANPAYPQPSGVHVPGYLIYNGLVVPPAVAAFHLGRFTSDKIRAGAEGRRGLWERLSARREQLQGAVWLHATSVGEYEQARPLLRALRTEAAKRDVALPLLVTVFSPSGHGFAAGRDDADLVEYLPLDTVPAAERLMHWIRPRAIAFVKYDCWPNLVWSARRRNVPVLLLGAALQPRSMRLSPWARWFFRGLMDSFTAIGTISDADARRFRDRIGVGAPIDVTGDTRVDQVIHRWQEAQHSPWVRALQSVPRRYITLGSIWPEDEEVTVAATLEALNRHEDLACLAVPHEPTETALRRLEKLASDAGVTSSRLSECVDPANPQVAPEAARWIVVDSVGKLAELYRVSIVSYVGGGFGPGVHSVLEPAVAGQPVVFGPRHHNAFEAARLISAGGAFEVESAGSFDRCLRGFLEDENARGRAGDAARRYVHEQRGATEASLRLLRPHAFTAESGTTQERSS